MTDESPLPARSGIRFQVHWTGDRTALSWSFSALHWPEGRSPQLRLLLHGMTDVSDLDAAGLDRLAQLVIEAAPPDA